MEYEIQIVKREQLKESGFIEKITGVKNRQSESVIYMQCVNNLNLENVIFAVNSASKGAK